MRLRRLLLALTLAGLLAACRAPAPASQATATPPPTSAATQAPASATPAASTATAASTAPPTGTAPPTSTATPTSAATATPRRAESAGFLQRPDGASLRVMSYNINWDSIFPPQDPENHDLRSGSRVSAFRRIVAAIAPDVVCLQEINPERDPAQVGALLGEILEPDGVPWSAVSTRDSFIASRYPVLAEGYALAAPAFPRELAQAAALIDLPDDAYGPLDLYVLCAHFKAGGSFYDIVLRQRQADVLMRQVGDALTPGGSLDLPAGTPLLILGDFNIYDTDPAAHLTTLLTGDIHNEDNYGPDVAPDWDGTGLADAAPSHNAQGDATYTWRNDASPLNPGALDRILYADSVLTAEHAFVLNTSLMTSAALDAAGLRADDVFLNPATGYYDHLPLIVDFAVGGP